MQNEKRLFQRVSINLSGQLVSPEGTTQVQVLDVSLQGVRLLVPIAASSYLPSASADKQVQLSFNANEDSPSIVLTGIVSHQQSANDSSETFEAGVKVTHIDVEDLGLLRRLLLLNSGQEDMDAAELQTLVDKITNALEH